MVTIEMLEKQYNELVDKMINFVQKRVETDVKIEKPFDQLREELHVDMMYDTSKNRFEWWTVKFDGEVQLEGSFGTPYFIESTDKYWRLLLFRNEKVDSEDLFSTYMNKVTSPTKTFFAFGTVDEPLQFSQFIQSFKEKDYDELHDILWLALLNVNDLTNRELSCLNEVSDAFKRNIERTAKTSCCDFVFGERSY